ncbi:5-methylcytosine-specific restriction enzyme B [Paenibacillus sp. yr247]|uniref:hypothetical protein n=1 Tax=Paenibacillus sp. yr247 TaxID=1761880 RepID=UPI000889079D|nr:hypothetical protein [Paenibacillus sp. yr247]SDO58254.1 5-methylcytosine-specific restriction enzyme B [Paenibacillus sp. yr247]
MTLTKEFDVWLVSSRNKRYGNTLSASSAYKYSRAINTISEDMIKIGLLERSLYTINSLHDLERGIERIKENEFFISKNSTGHNMYSVALEHYLNFLRDRGYN